MKPHRILDPDQFHANRVCCSFGITEFLVPIAVGALAEGAAAGGEVALGAGLAEGAAAGGALGAIGAGGLAEGALAGGALGGLGLAEGAGLGLAEGAGLFAADAGLLGGAAGAFDFAGLGAGLGAGEAGLAGGAGAAAGIPTASALEAGVGAAGAGASAAGAVTSPLAALEAGSATSILDAGAGAGGAAGAGLGEGAGTGVLETAASAASADSLNPMNWTGFEAVDAATGQPVASGTFPLASEGGAAAAPNAFTASVNSAVPGLNAANDVIDTAAAGASGPATSALGSAGGLTQSGTSLGTAASAGGVGDTLSSALGGLKTLAPLAPLGLLGATLLKGPGSLPPAEQQVEGAASSLLSTGQQNLTMAANQQITAPQMAEIDTWKQQQRNALYQLYAKSGRDPNTDTDYLQGLQQIEQQAIGMQQQFIDQLIQTGLGETGQATSALQNAAQMQIQQDKDFQASLSSAIQAFGLTAGLSGLNVNLSKAP